MIGGVMEEFNVGKTIKSLRLAQNMSAKELASSAGISYGMLSQLESGSTQGSVETLRRIAKVLDVTLAQLFANEVAPEAPSDESSIIVRHNRRKTISFPDPLYTCQMLTPDLQGSIEFVLVTLQPGRVTNEILPHTRGGEECDYVLEGVIEVTLGEKVFTLYAGDCIRFDPSIAHKIENKSSAVAKYISAITPPSF
jgi:transcriptional regulator with XRE-family HTH domain